jgi:hypothetical protein
VLDELTQQTDHLILTLRDVSRDLAGAHAEPYP